jgi:hypothetical protein
MQRNCFAAESHPVPIGFRFSGSRDARGAGLGGDLSVALPAAATACGRRVPRPIARWPTSSGSPSGCPSWRPRASVGVDSDDHTTTMSTRPRRQPPASRPVYVELCRRLEGVTDCLLEGEEAVLHVMGIQKQARNAATRGHPSEESRSIRFDRASEKPQPVDTPSDPK